MNKFDFNNRTAVITGGGQGFGLDIAKRFLKSGAKVIIWDIDEELLKSTVTELNDSNLSYNVVDVSNYTQIEKTVSEITLKDKIDILINNAGITQDNLSIRLTEDNWKKVIDINLTATFLMCKFSIKKMLKNKYGKIINITSIVGHTGNLGQANYAASKAGILAFSKSLALEYAKKSININCVAPGFIKTEMTEKINEEFKKILISKIPSGDLGTGEDVSNCVAFLASDMSKYINGETIHVNGGMYMA